MEKIIPQYENGHLCRECTGAGCKQCYDALGLRRLGCETFPISSLITSAKAPRIARDPGYRKINGYTLLKNYPTHGS